MDRDLAWTAGTDMAGGSRWFCLAAGLVGPLASRRAGCVCLGGAGPQYVDRYT